MANQIREIGAFVAFELPQAANLHEAGLMVLADARAPTPQARLKEAGLMVLHLSPSAVPSPIEGSWSSGPSAWSGTVAATASLAGSWTDSDAAWTGTLSGLGALAGAWSGLSAWTGTLAATGELTGAWDASASLWSGTLGATIGLSGSWADSASDWSGELAALAAVSGSWSTFSLWPATIAVLLPGDTLSGSWTLSRSRWEGRLKRIGRETLVIITRTLEIETGRLYEVELEDTVVDAAEVVDSIVATKVLGDAE